MNNSPQHGRWILGIRGRAAGACVLALGIPVGLAAVAAPAAQAQIFAPPNANAEAPRHRHAPIGSTQVRPGGTGTNPVWSGYEVLGMTDSVTDVKGSWTVPAVTCTGSTNTYSAVWVGIVGRSSEENATIEQIGTESSCKNNGNGTKPVYFAWYEFYHLNDNGFTRIESIKVSPGNQISAHVAVDTVNGIFTLTITDGMQKPFSTSKKVNGAPRSRADWIVEDPETLQDQVLPLANFGKVNFSHDSATISGVTGPIGSFKKNGAITMTSDGTATGAAEAIPSPLAKNESSFSVAYVDLTTLVSFNGTDGSTPLTAVLVQGTDGNFYGTTFLGGAYDEGTVFNMTPGRTLTSMHSFNGADGSYPEAGLVQGTDGNFYGTTSGGDGTVYQITPGRTLTTLYGFSGSDGYEPIGGLVQDADGNLYGTTYQGGAYSAGTVFMLSNTGGQVDGDLALQLYWRQRRIWTHRRPNARHRQELLRDHLWAWHPISTEHGLPDHAGGQADHPPQLCPQAIRKSFPARSLSAVSEAPTSEE
jgi:uncharacterized repeat protein (TIGR03803 family)